MKRKILTIITTTVAILGCASLSWALQVNLDVSAWNFVVSTGSPYHHIDYNVTSSTAKAQATPTGSVANSSGFGGFGNGNDASAIAQKSNSGLDWSVGATGKADLITAAANPSPNATPLASNYKISASSSVKDSNNIGAVITLGANAYAGISQNFSVIRDYGPSPTNVYLDFDWAYNLTVVPEAGDPLGLRHVPEFFVNALLSAGQQFPASYDDFRKSGLIADGADHLTHVTMTILNVPVNTSGNFSIIVGSEIPVPEPSTFLLLGAGLVGAGLLRKRIRK